MNCAVVLSSIFIYSPFYIEWITPPRKKIHLHTETYLYDYAALCREWWIVASIHSSISLSIKATDLRPIFTCAGKRPSLISSYITVLLNPTLFRTSGTRINLITAVSFFIVFSSVVSTVVIIGKVEITRCRHWWTRFFEKVAGRGFRGK